MINLFFNYFHFNIVSNLFHHLDEIAQTRKIIEHKIICIANNKINKIQASLKDDRSIAMRLKEWWFEKKSIVQFKQKNKPALYVKVDELARALYPENSPFDRSQKIRELEKRDKLVEEIEKNNRPIKVIKIQTAFRGYLARNELIKKYIHKHFDVHTNVSSEKILKAQKIFLGEAHDNEQHEIQNAWVIDHLYKKGDLVLVEDQSQPSTWRADNPGKKVGQVNRVQKKITMWGWDDKSDKLMRCNQLTSVLGCVLDTLQYFEKTLKKNDYDLATKNFQSICPLFDTCTEIVNNHEFIEQIFNKGQAFPVFAFLTLHIAHILFLEVAQETKECWKRRQKSLIDKMTGVIKPLPIFHEEIHQKMFAIAGINHLFDTETGKVEENLISGLKEHPHAILIPKTPSTIHSSQLANQMNPIEKTIKKGVSSSSDVTRIIQFCENHIKEIDQGRIYLHSKGFPI